jgi:hypothetical protein
MEGRCEYCVYWNKQSWSAGKGWSSSLGVGRGANNSSRYKIILLRNNTNGLGLGRIIFEGSCEHGNEPSGSIKLWEILEQLSDWWLLKKDPTPWS